MYCNNCGKVIQDDANLCAYCGKRLRPTACEKHLMRSRSQRKIAGVCAGFASYFELDMTLMRIVWLVVAIMTGFGFIAYLIAWIVMPEEPLQPTVSVTSQQVAT
jgi:phage shock protein C